MFIGKFFMLECVVCIYCVYKCCCKIIFLLIFYFFGLWVVSIDESENFRNINWIFNGMKISGNVVL